MFSFFKQEYSDFSAFLEGLNKQNWGSWPSSDTWPRYKGMPGYTINQYEQTNGKTFVVVKFDKQVIIPDGYGEYRKGKRFKVGGDRNYQPVCEWF
ncbi:MAG: hypothetical protein R6W78_10465 [Bacteroidales bacterium]